MTVETAIDIGGEPLVPHEIYPGAPVFRPETIDGVSTYTCAYSAPGDPSVRQFTMTLSYSVDGSASTRWEVYVDGFLGPDNIPTDRVPGEAYERVWSADPGALEVAIDTRTATAFIQSNVAAYGTDHTLEQVRAMAEAWATAAVAALEPTSASSAP